MSDHATPTVSHAHAAPVDGLRFEKSELEFFVNDDRSTGNKIGKMLALIFAILIVLMSFVAWWTNKHQSVGQDPFSVPTHSVGNGGH